MSNEDMIRELRNVANKYRGKVVHTGEVNITLMCEEVAKRLEELSQPKTDWIPCEEGLPSESGYYFACIYNEDVDDFDFRKTWFAHVLDYDIEESEWRELYEFETVTAWQPLPQPYKKEGAENGIL